MNTVDAKIEIFKQAINARTNNEMDKLELIANAGIIFDLDWGNYIFTIPEDCDIHALLKSLHKKDLEVPAERKKNELKMLREKLNANKLEPLGQHLVDATMTNNIDMINLLIEHGCDVNCFDEDGYTALWMATHLEMEESVEVLINAGADVNLHNPLIEAVSCDNIDITKMLLNAGASVNCTDENKNTPLHFAVFNSNYDIAKLLVNDGADIYAYNKVDETPLSLASQKGFYKILKMMIQKNYPVIP